MTGPDVPDQEMEASRDRLTRLSEATLRINESLDFDNVLQGAVDSARALTGARFGIIVTVDGSSEVEVFLTSGITPEDRDLLQKMPGRWELFSHFGRLPGPLRLEDFQSYAGALGLPEFNLLPVGAFLSAPIRHGGDNIGYIHLAKDRGGREFSQADEETLVMFAAQAALVISNARRHREEQRARADLETLIDTSPVGVAVFDARTGAPVTFNREAVRILEVLRAPDSAPEELLEVVTFRRADGRRVSLEEFPLAQALSDGETVRAEEIVIEVPDGRSVTTLVNATPIRSPDGQVESVVVTLQDMTPLEDLERLRAEFLGMVSHELRAPLTSIKGSADTLLESMNSLDPAEMVQFVRIIKYQAERMRDLISELLDVARVETGTLSVNAGPADVAGLVDEAKTTFLSGGGRRNFTVDMEPDLPWVMADRRRVVQVLGNLLSNAARYSNESSTIRVGAVLEDGYVAISVADEGRGVSPERLPHLFRKFSRIDGDEPEREVAGSGLGLAICKGIVEAHGGRIWAESGGVGLGARFTFTVPLVEAAPAGGAGPVPWGSAKSRRQPEERACVLAVDDDPMVLRYLRDALGAAGYLPVVSADPDEALRLVETERPRLVLLDLMLPGSDGIELMRNIHRIADVPVVFLSAYGRDEVIARAFEAGAVDYMVKPFSPTELVARVRSAMRRRLAPVQDEPPQPFVLGDLSIDYAERRVSLAGQPVHLTATEYGLLAELSMNVGRVLTHGVLLRRVWGPDHTGGRGTVSTAVKRLRRKLGEDVQHPEYVLTEPRVGYRMAKPEAQED